MVSFVCNVCQETLKKNKLDLHFNRCYNAYYSCIDCHTDFNGVEYRQHTSCISEAEKYQKTLYKGKKNGNNKINEHKRKVEEIKENENKIEVKEEKKIKKEEANQANSSEDKITKMVNDILDKKKSFKLSKLISKVSKKLDTKEDINDMVKQIVLKLVTEDSITFSK